jgi:hypothetical protein
MTVVPLSKTTTGPPPEPSLILKLQPRKISVAANPKPRKYVFFIFLLKAEMVTPWHRPKLAKDGKKFLN